MSTDLGVFAVACVVACIVACIAVCVVVLMASFVAGSLASVFGNRLACLAATEQPVLEPSVLEQHAAVDAALAVLADAERRLSSYYS